VESIDTLVLGGGISGLAIANRLASAGKPVRVLEPSAHLGGAVDTLHKEGFLVEKGPNSMLVKSQEVDDWLQELGLGPRIVEANAQADNRFLVKRGRLLPLPRSPQAAVRTPLYSFPEKLRLLAEPFLPRSPLSDESVTAFVSRRMGTAFLEYGISALVSGIYAGDPDRISLTHAFPKVWNLEQKYGSLIRGALALKRQRKREGITPYKNRLLSFRDGLSELTGALTKPLQNALLTESSLERLIYKAPGEWVARVTTPSGPCELKARSVVATVPLHQYGSVPFLETLDLPALQAVPYPPLSTVVLGFRREQVAHPLDGFGALFPRREKRFSLGAIFSSTLFPHRAPEGHVSIMCFIGGVQQPENAALPAPKLIEATVADLQPLLGLSGEPVFTHHTFWEKAIPQYNVGHGQVKAEAAATEKAYPGLFLKGNFRSGPGLHDALANALAHPIT
jgi:oxygen-dependent protoporphyrinogen oxidase